MLILVFSFYRLLRRPSEGAGLLACARSAHEPMAEVRCNSSFNSRNPDQGGLPSCSIPVSEKTRRAVCLSRRVNGKRGHKRGYQTIALDAVIARLSPIVDTRTGAFPTARASVPFWSARARPCFPLAASRRGETKRRRVLLLKRIPGLAICSPIPTGLRPPAQGREGRAPWVVVPQTSQPQRGCGPDPPERTLIPLASRGHPIAFTFPRTFFPWDPFGLGDWQRPGSPTLLFNRPQDLSAVELWDGIPLGFCADPLGFLRIG
jgi:hypothetical protein